MRFVVAFVVAPMLPALVPAWAAYNNGSYHPLTVFFLVCGAFYALQTIVGVPAYLLLGRARRHQIWIYAVIGFASVALPLFVYGMIRAPGHDAGQALLLTSYLGLLGGISAAIFWLVVRPDRTREAA